MLALARFVGRRILNGRLATHPTVRRVVMVVAVVGWFRHRFPAQTQRVTLKKGETLRVEVTKSGGRN